MTHTLEKIVSIISIDFIAKNILLLNLSNERVLFVPLDNYPEIYQLTEEQRKDYEIIDDQQLSFLAISEIYSLQELAGF